MQMMQVLAFQHSLPPLPLPPPILSQSQRPSTHSLLLSHGSRDDMHDVTDLQETMLPYMDITTKALLAVGNQVVAVV